MSSTAAQIAGQTGQRAEIHGPQNRRRQKPNLQANRLSPRLRVVRPPSCPANDPKNSRPSSTASSREHQPATETEQIPRARTKWPSTNG